MEIARTKEEFKKIDGFELNIHIFNPFNTNDKNPRTAIIFFFGGGFIGGTPLQFYPHCIHLATNRGIFAISAEYRVNSVHKTTPAESILDGKSVIRWLRKNYTRFNIDPNKIIAAGGSAGGGLAICTSLVDNFEPPNEDLSIHSKPNALILFNPVVTFRSKDLSRLSPMNNIKKNIPPAIIFHGTADRLVPFIDAQEFTQKMIEKGNSCELVPFEGKPHAFFNKGKYDDIPYDEILEFIDRFLKEIGFL
jgi:acetyl esterase/lipase